MTGLMAAGAGISPSNFNGEEEEQKPNVTPEEQAQYDQFVKNGMEMLYTHDGKIPPEILGRLGRGKPVEALAQTGVWLVSMLENSAKQSGKQIDPAVLMHGGKELFEQLATIAQTAHIHSFSEKELQGAWYSALDMYRETATQSGDFDPKEAAGEFVQLNEADKEGRADDVLPGFSMAEQQARRMVHDDNQQSDTEQMPPAQPGMG